ncbi:DNA mismatch repair protein PMS1 [Nakaseomyces bracarensis]|uniref:DNA mismatch repair protein PMS1 n=1 Tax=Nakaseomyces bracarensis TaxID=273131 RepID=A0ABR4NXT0_9SACH
MSISQIPQHDVHRITSGQVIVDLASAVKELVENSLDAGATQIDINFKKYGVEGLEVGDDGSGIEKEDYETLALKHYTSKIREFEDVMNNVNTLGFRGEALSSLCGIANLEVITTTSPPRADKLQYDLSGKLKSKSTTTRNKGTSIVITDIFHNLPVRQKEFVRTSKRQFTKCVGLIQSYALINETLRFSVTNTTGNGKKSTILSTTKNQTLNKRILNIFGASSMHGLSEIDITLNLNPYKKSLQSRYIDDPTFDKLDYTIRVKGYISKNSFGCGRTSKDRQYIFINKRPIDYLSVVKCCNEVYRSYNNVQYPMFILDFQLKSELLDINITPDKRTVILHNEQSVIDILREALIEYYDNQELALPKNEPSDQTIKRRKVYDESSDNYDEETSVNEGLSLGKDSSFISQKDMDITELIEHSTSYLERDEEMDGIQPDNKLPNSEPDYVDSDEDAMTQVAAANGSLSSNKNNYLSQGVKTKESDNGVEYQLRNTKRSKVLNADDFINPDYPIDSTLSDKQNTPDILEEPVIVEIDEEKYTHHVRMTRSNDLVFIDGNEATSQEVQEKEYPSEVSNTEIPIENSKCTHQNKGKSDDQLTVFDEDNDDELVSLAPTELNIRSPLALRSSSSKRDIYRSMSDNVMNKNSDDIVNFSMPFHGIGNINETLDIIKDIKDELKSEKKSQIVKNHALEDLDEGAEYLSLSVKKKDFQDMSIVGQFNLGFIIVTRKVDDKYDLFIVDQHASDEKYNFETLQQTTKFKSQRLISEQTIELSVIDELIVMDNIEVFERNGFKIRVDEDSLAGQKIKLISIPISKRTVFGVSDFHELIYLIKEDGGVHKNNIRCSKIRSMFAMRACRSSIMVGKPLNKRTMLRVVQNLSTLDKPWNCPHGRPTMRHLMELKDWKSFSADYQL